jgi:proteic killer suppression protein
MIKSFRHKGLEDFFHTGTRKGVIADHSSRLARILDRLDASTAVKDMELPGFRLHELKGKEKDIWSVWVSGNWRVTFYFKRGDAYVVDYRDYH